VTHRCERARAAISLELDDELSPLERAFLERHLARCAGCRAFRLECAGFTRELRDASLERMAGFAGDVVALRRVRRRVLPRQVAAIASVATLAVGGLYTIAQVEQTATEPEHAAPPAYLESTDFELALLRPAFAKRGTNNDVPL
jgi:predicted anti-sigma-YlaC factor YlaD